MKFVGLIVLSPGLCVLGLKIFYNFSTKLFVWSFRFILMPEAPLVLLMIASCECDFIWIFRGIRVHRL
jgi:hypothetical protein